MERLLVDLHGRPGRGDWAGRFLRMVLGPKIGQRKLHAAVGLVLVLVCEVHLIWKVHGRRAAEGKRVEEVGEARQGEVGQR